MTRNPPDIDGRGHEPTLARSGAAPAVGGERQPRPGAGRVSIRLLTDNRDIDETWPLTLAAHEESRHREHPIDPERQRSLLAKRFLADRTRYGFLIARYSGRLVGMLTCLADRLHYTDVTVVSCLSFYSFPTGKQRDMKNTRTFQKIDHWLKWESK